ncbi:hypothetical protein C8J57DRAFT_1096186, partial [Mycena rebaudengoi]
MAIVDPVVKKKLTDLDSGKTCQRMGKILLVIGMPVMFSQNFDVPGGVVNRSTGTLKSIRYVLDDNGDRHTISCIVHSEDTSDFVVPGLPNHHVVALEDKVLVSL